VQLDDLFPDADAIAARRSVVLTAFADLDPAGRLGEECWRDYSVKLTRWSAARATVEEVFTDWDRHRVTVEEMLVDSATLGAGLVAARAVARFGDLDPAVDDATVRWALAHCHLMRNRFTVVDLLDLLGRWTADDVDAVVATASAAVEQTHAAAPSTGHPRAGGTSPSPTR
jgi:glycerol-1-phosphate dehydrogenase [NAD(P)+]